MRNTKLYRDPVSNIVVSAPIADCIDYVSSDSTNGKHFV